MSTFTVATSKIAFLFFFFRFGPIFGFVYGTNSKSQMVKIRAFNIQNVVSNFGIFVLRAVSKPQMPNGRKTDAYNFYTASPLFSAPRGLVGNHLNRTINSRFTVQCNFDYRYFQRVRNKSITTTFARRKS